MIYTLLRQKDHKWLIHDVGWNFTIDYSLWTIIMHELGMIFLYICFFLHSPRSQPFSFHVRSGFIPKSGPLFFNTSGHVSIDVNFLSHMFHVWNLYLHLPNKWPSFVGKYTIHGASWLWFQLPFTQIIRNSLESGYSGSATGTADVKLRFQNHVLDIRSSNTLWKTIGKAIGKWWFHGIWWYLYLQVIDQTWLANWMEVYSWENNL